MFVGKLEEMIEIHKKQEDDMCSTTLQLQMELDDLKVWSFILAQSALLTEQGKRKKRKKKPKENRFNHEITSKLQKTH